MSMLSRFRVTAARLALVAWAIAMLVLGAGLLVRHAVALPAPVAGRALSASLSAMRPPNAQHRWLVIHTLYAECRCSQRIVDHLIASTRPAGWRELVLWVGDKEPSPQLTARFDVKRWSNEDLARVGIEAAPSFAVLDPSNHLLYAGGYTDRKQGPNIDDLRIFEELEQSRTVAPHPVFGCAVSARLRQALAVLPSP